MKDFFQKLFDTSDFPARWYCGNWSAFHGWLYILSDLAIFGAYATIPISIAYFVIIKRQEIAFTRLYWFFAAFILSCGLTHLIDATLFWHPWYRVAAVVEFITALASWSTVVLLIRALPVALALPGTTKLNAALQAEIEERRRSEAALQESVTRLHLAVQHSKLGDWSWDPNSDKTNFSDRAKEIFGLIPGSTETWGAISQFLHPDDRKRVAIAVADSIGRHSDYDIEYRIIRPSDGKEIWASAKGRAIYGDDGVVINMLGTLEDITSRKRIEAEREELLASERAARTEAERANRIKDEFLATLSHELRTPLNAILGWAQLLADETDESQRRAGLRVIERNSRNQAKLVDDLLDMSRIITGKIRFDVQIVDLVPVIQAALDGVRPSAEAKHLQLVTSLDPLTGPVRGDPARLQQIIWNLLTNAIKFTPHNGRVEISLQKTDSQIEIIVSDNGEGIWPEFLPFIFDRFRQADSSATRRHGGLGLGLSIVKSLVELHGGSVSAKSSGANQGARFSVRLPTIRSEDTYPDGQPRLF